MKNLKTTSLYKIIIIILGIGIILCRINTKSKFKDETTIIGTIDKINTTEDKTQIELLSKEKILVVIYEKTNYKLGDTIKIEGKLETPSNNTFFNLFNYKNYLKSKKINYIFKAKIIKLVKENKSIKYKIKNNLIKYIEKHKTKNYLKTFILGDNKEIEEDIIKTYQINGISHLFAVSGMHLSLFAIILNFILKRIIKKENINNLIIILFFIFFSFLTNYSPSILRALILYISLTINKIFNLKIKTIDLIILDLIILLIYNPYYIYNIGFIYSFATTITLIITSNIINKYKNYISKTFITSLISFTTSIPISINNFHEINLLTPIINILFVPLISFIIFPLSLLTLLIKQLDNIFLISINILEQLSILIKKINIEIILSHIPWYIIILYYIMIFLFIKGLKNKKAKYALPLIILLIIHTNIKLIKQETKTTTLDVGQGDSILLELPKNKNILIDTGGKPNSKSSIVITKTIPYLKSLGIKKISYLILTHSDFDHMGESINLVNNFKVEKIIFNCGPYNNTEKELIKISEKKHIKYYTCISELNINKNKLFFLQTKVYDNENDNSNVIYTELNNYKFLFMGDAEIEKENDLLKKYNLPNIDVLKVGHHGSKTSSNKEFIDKTKPKYSVISVGNNNRYGHPNKETLENLKESKIYRTDEDGSIMFKIKNNKLKIETCNP